MTSRNKIIFRAALVVICATGAVLDPTTLFGKLDGALAGMWIVLLVKSIKEHRDGNRRTARDRDDPNPYPAFASGGPVGTAVRSPAEGTHPGLTETVADVPILAFKTAALTWTPYRGPAFQPLTRGGTYGVDADALCLGDPMVAGIHASLAAMYGSRVHLVNQAREHAAPDAACNCGFHARTTTDLADTLGGSVLLDVELSGRVIIHETGYRAEHQRVIGAHLRGCYWCGDSPTRVEFTTSPYTLRPVCAAHSTEPIYLTIGALSERLGVLVDVKEPAA